MEKLQSLLWILLAIGAFVYRMIKKMQETSARESRERPPLPRSQASTVPALPTASFQELLRQMQARNVAEAGPSPAVVPANQPVAPAATRTIGGRLVPRKLAPPARSQERTSRRMVSLEAPATAKPINPPVPLVRPAAALPRASKEAPMEDYWQERTRLRAAVRLDVPVGQVVRQLLRQPESVQAAFVLSEILQRRSLAAVPQMPE